MVKLKKKFIGHSTKSNILNKMITINEDNMHVLLADNRIDLFEDEPKKELVPVNTDLEDLEGMTLKELKSYAESNSIEYKGLKKAELIDLILKSK